MKKLSQKATIFSLILIVMVLSAFMPAPKKITVKGSDTMVILAQKWAEVYMKTHPDVTIQVTGGGSGTGIAALINGATDICNSSRQIKPSEVDKLKQRYNSPGVEIPCAQDGITIFLHADNPLQELTLKQISDIYAGRIKNWKEVGGPDATIRLYGRENSSGTYVFFKEKVVKGDYAPNTNTLPGTAAVVNAVKKDKFGIGYGGAAYAEGVKHCKVKKDAATPGYLPTAENIRNKQYPITRYLYMYMANRPTGETKAYIDWILSAEGQKYVTQIGYFPVK